MKSSVELTPENLLRLISQSAPQPWYPKIFVADMAINRESLDGPLAELRLAGLVRFTDWEPKVGQGYILTDFGKEVVNNSSLMSQLRRGLPVKKVEEPQPNSLENRRPSEDPTTYERGEQVRNALLYPERPRLLPILILLNCIAFAISIALAVRAGIPLNKFLYAGDAQVLRNLGALNALDLVRGEWWRLLAACFLHFGIIHLGLNMYGLWVSGRILEPIWGPSRFLMIYLFSGLAGAVTAMLYNPGTPLQMTLSAGASGAIWGMMTSILVWVLLNRSFIPEPEIQAFLRSWIFVFLLNVGISFLPNISASAHFGGGAGGLLITMLLHYQRYGVGVQRPLATSLILLAPIILFAALNNALHNDPRWKRFVELHEAQNKFQALLNIAKNTGSQIETIHKEFDQLEDTLKPILFIKPDDRNQEDINQAVNQIIQLREVAEATAKELEEPNKDADAEKMRLAIQEYIENLLFVLEERQIQVTARIQIDDPGPKFRKALKQVEQLRNQLKELNRR